MKKTACCSTAFFKSPSWQLKRHFLTHIRRHYNLMSEQSALLAYFHHAPERILVASPPVSLQSSEAATSWWTDFLTIPVTDAHRLTPRHEEGHVSPSAGMWMPGRQLPLGKVIKQSISFWGYLIVQPAPKSLAALCPTETGSHSSRRDRAPDCQSLETTENNWLRAAISGFRWKRRMKRSYTQCIPEWA